MTKKQLIEKEENFLKQIINLYNNESDPHFKILYNKDIQNSIERIEKLKNH